MKKIKVMSLFSGVGGFENCFHEDENFEVIGFSEIDSNASAVLNYHWPEIKNYGDITRIIPEELPDFDLLVGGSPCQSFSISGKREGFNGRSGLFDYYVEILERKRPLYFIWENVVGTFSCSDGWDFAKVLFKISEAGYDYQWQVLNAKRFGVPQNRERIFLIGSLRGTSRSEILFKQRESRQVDISNQDVEQGEERESTEFIATKRLGRNQGLVTNCCPTIQTFDIPHIKLGECKVVAELWPGSIPGRVIDTSGSYPCIRTPSGGQTNALILEPPKSVVVDHGKIRETEIAQCIDANYFKGADNHGQRTLIAHSSSGRSYGREERLKEGEANTLTCGEGCSGQSSASYVKEDEVKIRRLTPRETELLMSWKLNHTQFGRLPNGTIKENSDSARYKMCGNGVVSKCVVPFKDYILKTEMMFDED